ncbi:unnamed protein product, partial [Mesorhabditis belari]|uniref:Uncharacterized protein n=1 Tax=Mesorhabditis belari TaxID=2138241 RepID=A0AAF3EGH1_9BILA
MSILIISVFLYFPFLVVVAASSQFHTNLIRIFIFLAFFMAVHSASRGVLLLYEFEILLRKESLILDLLLFTASITRGFLATLSALSVPLIIVER